MTAGGRVGGVEADSGAEIVLHELDQVCALFFEALRPRLLYKDPQD